MLFKTNPCGHFPEVCPHEPGVHALVFLTGAVLENLRGEINGGTHQSLQKQIYRDEWKTLGKTQSVVTDCQQISQFGEGQTTAGILSV